MIVAAEFIHSCERTEACMFADSFGGVVGNVINCCNGYFLCDDVGSPSGKVGNVVIKWNFVSSCITAGIRGIFES